MAIYRGPGGAGDATTDSSTEAAAALAAAAAAASSATNAANSATSAAASAASASTSAGNASADAGDAASSAAQALDSQLAAEAAQAAAELASDASINFAENLTVQATTLTPGSDATVTYDSNDLIIEFGIPRGTTGSTGATGATGATGEQGPQGDPGLVWKGAYSSGYTYNVDEAVSYNGSSYICTVTSTGNTPTNTSYWNLLAAKGTDGGGGGSGTVTSVDVTVPTGLSVSGVPITTSGTIDITLASGYSIPTTTKQGQWDTSYSWGNHASAGYAHAGANSDITSMTGISGGITTPDFVTFDTTPETTPTAAGSLYWDSADGNQTLSLIMAGGDVTQQIGQEQYYRIKASSAITNGQVVMFTGSVGASGALTGAPATGLTASTASYVMGIATQDIANNGWGYVTSFGLVRDLNTNAFADGDILYLDPTVAGGLTATVPTAPAPKVQVCAVTHAATNGSLFVRLSFGGILGQYEGDVNISSPTTGDVIVRNGSGVWENKALGSASGIQPYDADLSAIGALSGTSGLLKKTAANTWSLDTNTYLTSYTETDPVFVASAAHGISGTDITNWNTAYGWGNHASAGYLTTSSASSTYLALAGGALTGGLREAKVAMGASDISCTAGNYFTKTISTTTTLTVSNVPSTGTAACFILDLTNGGAATVNWWTGVKWAGGTAPTLTASGRDVLGFFTHDGGTTWSGLVLGKDVK